jgi:hypothetical protein
MPGYFDDILAAYGPAAPAPVNPPWSDPFLELPAPPDPDPATPPEPATEAPPPEPGPSTPARPRPEPLHAPDALFALWEPPDAPDPVLPETEVARETVRHERHIETRTIAEPSPGPTAPPPAPIHLHEDVDRSVTHLHEHLRIVDATAFEPDPDRPPPPDSPDPLPQPEVSGPDPRLAALEADLARLYGEDAPPSPFFTPEDFEPELPDAPAPPNLEPAREVTRELVREQHHHHHTETRIEAPPAAPAPRTAAEASRIGRIRFLSDWKTGLR